MSQDKPKPTDIDGRDLWFAVAAARYNGPLVDTLLERVRRTLRDAKVPSDHIKVVRVPGSSEVPYAAHMLAMTGEYDCVVALGVVVAGETPHHEVIAASTAAALQETALRSEVPVINGIVSAVFGLKVRVMDGGVTSTVSVWVSVAVLPAASVAVAESPTRPLRPAEGNTPE